MSDVGAVIALPLHDERFRPNHLRDRTNLLRSAENLSRLGIFEPVIIDRGDAVPGAENDIDKIISLIDLGEPMRKSELDLKTRSTEKFENRPNVSPAHENIQVLGIAPDSGVMFQGERAADQERSFGLDELGQHSPVEGSTSQRQMRPRKWK